MMPTSVRAGQPIAMVVFNGNCADAMRYYAQTLSGEIKLMQFVGETPMADQMPTEFADKVMYSQIQFADGTWLYGCDCAPHIPYEGIKAVTLVLEFDTVEEAEMLFNEFAEGGEVEVPFAPAPWAKAFGMVTDKFGVSWAVNGLLPRSGGIGEAS